MEEVIQKETKMPFEKFMDSPKEYETELRSRAEKRIIGNRFLRVKEEVNKIFEETEKLVIEKIGKIRNICFEFLNKDLETDMDKVIDIIREEDEAFRKEVIKKLTGEWEGRKKIPYASEFEKNLLSSIQNKVSPQALQARVDRDEGFHLQTLYQWYKEYFPWDCPPDVTEFLKRIKKEAPNYHVGKDNIVFSAFFKLCIVR